MMTKRGNPSKRYEVVEAVQKILRKKAKEDGPEATQIAAGNMIKGALLHVLNTGGEAGIWGTLTEIADDMEREIELRTEGHGILH